MTAWPNYLTSQEMARLEQIDASKRELQRERAALHNRAKQRKHRKGETR